MNISRRLFIVPLADNDHGKTTMIRSLVSQGLGRTIEKQKKGTRTLVSPHGRPIDSYVYGRSYQEIEKNAHKSVLGALKANDPEWYKRELIIMPSHAIDIDNEGDESDDIDQIIQAAHGAGFDVISATVLFTNGGQREWTQFQNIWNRGWDERWTIPNPRSKNWDGQLEALGRDLWVWICKALAG